MSEQPPVALRLKQLREEAGISVREMAQRIGKSPSSYGHYENPSRFKSEYLPLDLARQLAAAFGKKTQATKVLMLAGLPTEAAIVETAEPKTTPQRVEPGETPPDDSSLVPVYDVQASAGHGSYVGYETATHSLAFPPEYLAKLTSSSPKNLAIISVKGDSMEPTLLDDDIVLLDGSKTDLGYDGLFVVDFEDKLHVKRIGRGSKRGFVQIISDNPLFPAQEWPINEVRAVGKVLWYGRRV